MDLSEHDQAVMPGQSAVWYSEEVLLGGGIIQGTDPVRASSRIETSAGAHPGNRFLLETYEADPMNSARTMESMRETQRRRLQYHSELQMPRAGWLREWYFVGTDVRVVFESQGRKGRSNTPRDTLGLSRLPGVSPP
jgi:hypothetical protein